jgi:O-antigen/teichoic acid export membrane protein
VLVPSLGIAGAGLALVGAYAVMLVAMWALTRKLFPVAFEWGRLALFVVLVGGVTAAGELLLPTDGVVGFVSRAAVLAVLPLALVGARFFRPGELRAARRLLSRGRPDRSAEAPAAG